MHTIFTCLLFLDKAGKITGLLTLSCSPISQSAACVGCHLLLWVALQELGVRSQITIC